MKYIVLFWLLAMQLFLGTLSPVAAQVYEKLFSFTDALKTAPTGGVGSFRGPNRWVEGSDGNFYGTTDPSFTGDFGGTSTFFKMTPAGWLTPLHRFAGGTEGAVAQLQITGLDGKFYGTTSAAGATNSGSIFRVSRQGEFSTLVEFSGTAGGNRGTNPVKLLQSYDGVFYGMTSSGGAGDCGTIFSMNTAGVLTTLVEFTGASGLRPGRNPNNLIQGKDGNLYGTTAADGSGGYGTVFKLTKGGQFSVLVQFTGNAGTQSGSGPQTLFQAADGNFYGTTSIGSTTSSGTFFGMSAAGVMTPLHSFDGPKGPPRYGLVQSLDGTIYGTTGYPGGSVYKWTPSGQFAIIVDFASVPSPVAKPPDVIYEDYRYDASPGPPNSQLLLGADGNLYGTAEVKFPYSFGYIGGSIYRINPAGQITILESFYGDIASDMPRYAGNLVRGRDGYLYGTTSEGGRGRTNGGGEGTIFRLPDAGGPGRFAGGKGADIIAEIGVSMNSDIPSSPRSGLIQGKNGDSNFYGTSFEGGLYNRGTVFKLSPAGELSTLGSFGGNDSYGSNFGDFLGLHPVADLVDGGDGRLYGTTTSDFGNVDSFHYAGQFGISKDGGDTDFKYLYLDLSTKSKEFDPRCGLVKSSDGNFYGVMPHHSGGSIFPYTGGNAGTIFLKNTSGEISRVADFSGTPLGANPGSQMIEVVTGGQISLYGTTLAGGSSNHGSVFNVTPSGTVTQLASLNDAEGPTTSTAAWQNTSIGLKNASFSLAFKITPNAASMDGVTGLALGNAGQYEDLACALRLSPNGYFDAISGSGYQKKNTLNYVVGHDYSVVLTVNLVARTYSATVDGIIVAENYPFRAQKLVTTGLDRLVVKRETGSHTVKGLKEARQGNYPLAAIIRAEDGYFYGMAAKGGAFDMGTVFKVSPQGVLTKLVDFTGNGAANKGSQPVASLVEHADGYFYGTTSHGGSRDMGTIFRMSPSGSLETIFDFGSDEEDSVPLGRLIKGNDGNLYGTTSGNGGGAGGVYRMIFDGKPVIHALQLPEKIYEAVSIHGKFNPRGATAEAWLEVWRYTDRGTSLPPLKEDLPSVPLSSYLSGYQTVDLGATLQELAGGVRYHCRFVSRNSHGTTYGEELTFDTIGAPTPEVAAATNIKQDAARLHGLLSAGNATTSAVFEYGIDGTNFPDKVIASPLGDGELDGMERVPIAATIGNLQGGKTYHYRIFAKNEKGTALSGSGFFTTLATPVAELGAAEALSTTRACVTGMVDTLGSNAAVSFEWGVDGEEGDGDEDADYPHSASAVPGTVSGNGATPVQAVMTGLVQGKTYHYRIRAEGPGGTGLSAKGTISLSILSGLVQVFPDPPLPSNGKVTVNFTPASRGGWRFEGETVWRKSGVVADHLAGGKRLIEFLPVTGYISPPQETLDVTSTGNLTLDRIYYQTPSAGDGGLTVRLKPEGLGGKWRIVGEAAWRGSGAYLTGKSAGSYSVECKPVAGRDTPSVVSVSIESGGTRQLTLTYYTTNTTGAAAPLPLDFNSVSADEDLPFAYVGQIRSQVGSSSGFVVKRRVVATAGHVVFDDGTLSAVTNLQWLLQRHNGRNEPQPQVPRGYYLAAGYADQRIADASPGAGSPQSQHLDYAALYFSEEAGRGGYGGYLASDSGDDNEFLDSTAEKILAGYAVDGIPEADQGMLHGAAPFTSALLPAYGETWTSTAVRGQGGCSGGPLFVRHGNGSYYPAAIYLGGSGQTVVRAIDSSVVDLFLRAEVSGNGGDNNTGGGVTHTGVTGTEDVEEPGTLVVKIVPAGAAALARWGLKPELPIRRSGDRRGDLTAGPYQLVASIGVPGYKDPVATYKEVTIPGGQITTYTITYAPEPPSENAEISVEEPAGTSLKDGKSTSAFGNAVVKSPVTKTYTIRNLGKKNLTGIAVSREGAAAGDFSVTKPLKTSLAFGKTTTFQVTFKPTTTGSRKAELHITSNDTDESPFDITLTGKGIAANTLAVLAARSRLPSWVELYPGASGKFSNGERGSVRQEMLTTVEFFGGRKYQTLTILKRPGDLYLERGVEVSPNLMDWYSGARHTTVVEDSVKVFKARDNTPVEPGRKRFIRVRDER
ncbi:MAG: choice-of-anchor tandem repeat GloVer-containing protein [Verrucomicrobiota bacterium]